MSAGGSVRALRALARTGTYSGSTVGRPSRVQQYRYPEVAVPPQAGPELLFRVSVRRPVANFGVAVLAAFGIDRVLAGGRVGKPALQRFQVHHTNVRQLGRGRSGDEQADDDSEGARERQPSASGAAAPRS